MVTLMEVKLYLWCKIQNATMPNVHCHDMWEIITLKISIKACYWCLPCLILVLNDMLCSGHNL